MGTDWRKLDPEEIIKYEKELMHRVSIYQSYRKGYCKGTQHGFAIGTLVYLLILLIIFW